MELEEFDYYLPEELIAQVPIKNRDESRLMVLNREKHTIEDKIFKDIIDYLEPGDCLVRNNTKVIPARLYGKKDTGANVEFVLLKNIEGNKWEVMCRPGNKIHVGTKIYFDGEKFSGDEPEFENNASDNLRKANSADVKNENNENNEDNNYADLKNTNGEDRANIKENDGRKKHLLTANVLDITDDGTRIVEFSYDGIFNEILDKIGLMPLPPYIHESLKENDRYQTVYAKYDGSAAAPTAGLHFTNELLDEIQKKGVEIANITLHVGIGTFRPVKEEKIEDHKMHVEHYYIKEEDAEKINKAKRDGHRVIAVGTTSCRTLETVADENGFVRACEGDTGIYIYPGYKFKCMDGLITNFHLPKSTLIMLVSAFAGKDYIMEAYKHAVDEKYRFFSFGDAMFIQ